jgi:hypothetical protein
MPDANLIPKLIERLISLTAEGKIDWKETASEDDFQATVAQHVVTISRATNRNNWDAFEYKIRVADRKGSLIDEAMPDDFDGDLRIREVRAEGKTTLLPAFEAFIRLYDAARRSARNVDKALTELLSSLDSLEK